MDKKFYLLLLLILLLIPFNAHCKWSLEIDKPSTTAGEVGWITESHAQRYWNGMQSGVLYNIGAYVKTEGVNTSPSDSTYQIGLRWEFFDSLGNSIGYAFIPADQSVASKDWDSLETFITLTSEPDSDYCFFFFGPNATGRAWADEFFLSSSPWTAGFFGGSCETPMGWMEWHSVGDVGVAEYTDEEAYSGSYSAKLEDLDALPDEIVFYSIPYPVDSNDIYIYSAYTKKVDVNTDPHFIPGNWCGIRDDSRIGFTVGFHDAPITTAWNWLGDNFFYINQVDSMSDWEQTLVVAPAHHTADGASIRARFTSFPTGTVYYDDFSIQKIEVGSNILGNGNFETEEPFWWYDYGTGATMTWATDGAYGGNRSLKIEKASTSGGFVGWQSGDQAKTYWNNMIGGTLYHIGAVIKTSGVNTSPADSTEEIGLKWEFLDAGGSQIGYVWLPVDQSVASKDWDTVDSYITLPSDPDSAYCAFLFGPDATGTAWADNFILSSSPWTAGFFGADLETPMGWMEWHSTGDTGVAEYTDEEAYSGTFSAKLQDMDSLPDEIVFYSIPYPCDSNTWYHFEAWVKKVNVNTDPHYLPGNVTDIRDDQRIGFTIGFVDGPINEAWNWLGDNFFYINQVDSSGDWEKYEVLALSPSNAEGVTIRARFTSFPMGTVYYDDFEIKEVTTIHPNIIANGDLETVEPFFFHKIGTGATLRWTDSLDCTGIDDEHYGTPSSFRLLNNYPNPFMDRTRISYELPRNTHVNLSIYDLMGRRIITLVNEHRSAGSHTIFWDGRTQNGERAARGIYFYRLSTKEFQDSRKMIFLR